MSTNFYIEEVSVNRITRRRVVDLTHIGKRSGGWTFLFQGQETKSTSDWRERLDGLAPNQRIVDEYGTEHTVEEFWEAVEATKKPWGPHKRRPLNDAEEIDKFNAGTDHKRWADDGFSFSAHEFC